VYVQRTQANPAYQVVAAAVAVLVFLSLLNQFILFAAALTATSTCGTVTDLAVHRPPARSASTVTVATTSRHRPGRRPVRARRRRVRAGRRGPPGRPR
jgi:hypothetical protein